MDNKYNVYNDVQYGKVYSYDGEAGIIVSKDGKYLFSKKDIYNDAALVKEDIVAFRVNHLPFPDEVVKVARSIEKVSEKENKRKV